MEGMMRSEEVRESFLNFFRGKGHTIVPSASLLPTSPNLLFTNSGMNQFVPYFLGDRPAPYKRVADTQKSIRAGGKHNDLEDVGFDTYHHTFFEMLGNWSFGEYFKREAIEWAWELITKVWKFPKNRLYATVYKPNEGDPANFDQEAYDIWSEIFRQEGMDPAIHIRYGGKKDNFWMMGETGPCGPCSELHMDLTPEGRSEGKLVNVDSPYCIEIWNLVFIQFNAEENGSFLPLKAKHVDTGMGFERVSGIIATTKNFTDFSNPPSNYNSDLFDDVFKKITEFSGIKYGATMPKDRNSMTQEEHRDCTFRVIGDHVRTLTFAIADGILPGNEGRNYVLRRILRRAVLFGKKLQLPHGFFVKLADCVIDKMGSFFPELIEQRKTICKVLAIEEESFERTLDRGLQLLERITADKKVITGEEAFTLYDTYGFPIDLTQIIARERSLSIDLHGFEQEMEKQRERARSAQKKSVISIADENTSVEKTVFVGYDQKNLANFPARLMGTHVNGVQKLLIFDKTPFYAEMGGQVGDSGKVEVKGQCFVIKNTIKDEKGCYLHEVDGDLELEIGSQVLLSVDVERRLAIQRHHTATHILHWALRKILGTHVRQSGSLVTPDTLRFDFSHFEGLTPQILREVEKLSNRCVLENINLVNKEVAFEEKPANCIAFFEEKYGAKVRMVDIGGFSVELCGGTHVKATGDIGFIKIRSESAIAAGVRRIEAVAGESAMELAFQSIDRVKQLADKIGCRTEDLEQRVDQLRQKNSDLEKQLRGFEQKNVAGQIDGLLTHAVESDGLKWVVGEVSVPNAADMRGLCSQLIARIHNGVVVLGADIEGKAAVAALCSDEAIKKGHNAGQLVKEITEKLGGKGGGKPDFAMGGGKDISQLPSVLSKVVR